MHPTRPLRRFGPAGDGGYLMPDDLDGIAASVSPGVAGECGFDLEIADRGIDVHLADASVDAPPTAHARFHFTPLFLDTATSAHTITLDDYCATIAPGNDLLLQMDIEGAEYRVLGAASESLMARFRIMVIEFHDLTKLFTRAGLAAVVPVFDKLLRTHHVVHIHPNNGLPVAQENGIAIPKVMEFTFYRKDRDTFGQSVATYPHPLDAPNLPHLPDIALPACWVHGPASPPRKLAIA